MKVYGYTKEQVEAGTETPSVLSEITFVSNPDNLRKLANAINNIAQEIEDNPDGFEHGHLTDNNEALSDTSIIVFNDEGL